MAYYLRFPEKQGVFYEYLFLKVSLFLEGFKGMLKIGMLKADTCTIQDIPGFFEVNLIEVKYLKAVKIAYLIEQIGIFNWWSDTYKDPAND